MEICNASVQTEGHLLPYPPDSHWIRDTRANDGNCQNPLELLEDHSQKSLPKSVGSPPAVKVMKDPLLSKRPGRRHRKAQVSGRAISQRIVPVEPASSAQYLREDSFFDGDISVQGLSIKSRSQSADKKSFNDSIMLPSAVTEEIVGTEDDAVSSISHLTVSPRHC